MITPHFSVAKYIPDLARMEPRNFGLIVWADGGAMSTRFLGVDGTGRAHPPSMIEDDARHAYRQWIDFWLYHVAQGTVSRRDGSIVKRDSPKFLEALQEKSKEQFRLVPSGSSNERIKPSELEEFTDEMFARIVERERAGGPQAELAELKAACSELLKAIGIVDRIGSFFHDLPLPCRVRGVVRHFHADYAIGPIGKPLAVIQRVLLTRPQSVHSNAFMFESLMNAEVNPISRENCLAVVNTGQELNNEARSGMQLLENMVTVVDVAKFSDARVVFSEAALRAIQNPSGN